MINSYGQSVQSLRAASKGMYAGPAIPMSALDQAMRSIEGLDTQQIRHSARAARGRSQSGGARSLVQTLGELVLHVGMNMVSNELHRLVRSWWEEQRSADEVTKDTQDGTSAIDTVDEQCTQSVETVLSQLQLAITALSAALGALNPVLHAPAFQALVRSGAGAIDAAGSHVLGLCESRDKAVEQCLEKMVDHCRQRCEQPEQEPAKAVSGCEQVPSTVPAQQATPSSAGSGAAAPSTAPAQQATPSTVPAQQTAPSTMPAQQVPKDVASGQIKGQANDLIGQFKQTQEALKQEDITAKAGEASEETEPACVEKDDALNHEDKHEEKHEEQKCEQKTQTEPAEKEQCAEEEQEQESSQEESSQENECEEGAQFSGVLGLLGVGVVALGIGWIVQQISEHLGQWWEQLQHPVPAPEVPAPPAPETPAAEMPVAQAPVVEGPEPPPNPLKQNVKYAAAAVPAPAPVPAQEPVHSSGPAPKKAGSW